MRACRKESCSRASSPGFCSRPASCCCAGRSRAAWSDRRWLVVLRVLAIAFAAVQLASAVAVAVGGPWNLAWGPISAHAASAARPFMFALVALGLALASSPGFRGALRESSPLAFYLAATLVMWWCALGPDPKVGGEPSEVPGPFALLMQVPGFSSIRVPGRFWLMGTLSMSVVVAYVVAALVRARPATASGLIAAALSLAVLSDGWEAHMPTAAVPPGPPNPALLRGQVVLYLPAGNIADVFPTYYGVEYGWRSVNGYSGFEPNHYDGVRQASKFELDGLFAAFTESTDLHVVVAADAPRMREIVERQPGVRTTGKSATATQYVVPSRSRTVAMPRGAPAPVAEARSSCPPANILADQSLEEIWIVRAAGGHRNHHADAALDRAGDRRAHDSRAAGGIPAAAGDRDLARRQQLDAVAARRHRARVHSRRARGPHDAGGGAGDRAHGSAGRPPAPGGP